MSLYGSIAILVVLLFRIIFQKCPKKILILFWIAVAVRLCLPFNFNSPTSALNVGMAFSGKSGAEQSVSYDPETRLREITTPERPVQQPAADATVPVQTADGQAQDNAVSRASSEKTSGISFWDVVPVIWISVAAAMLVFSAVRYAVFYSRARWSSRSFDGRYYMANDIDSPFVVGIIKPKIFFPFEIDDDEREYVLNHEWTHIKYKDGLTKLLSYIVLCIHWFNPLVWLAFYMLCADIEMRVDEDTTGNFSLSMVKEYCKSLVRHASNDKGGTFMQSTAFSGLGFGGMETKIRIKNLLNRKIDSKAVQIGAIILTLPVVILISASSIDHKPPVRPEPAETLVTSETSGSSAADTETTEDSRKIFDNYIDAYMDLITSNGLNNKNYTYDLILADRDQIPELVVENANTDKEYSSEVSLYTFADGIVKPVFEHCIYDAIGTDCYSYVPGKDILIHVHYNGDILYDKYRYSLADLMNGKDPVITGQSDGTSFTAGGKSVTAEEFNTIFFFNDSKLISGYYRTQEITEFLLAGTVPPANKAEQQTTDPDISSETSGTSESSETPATSAASKGSFADLPDGTVMAFDIDIDRGSNYVKGVFGKIEIRSFNTGKTVINVNGQEFEEDIPHRRSLLPYLLKTDGETYIYWSIMDEETEKWSLYIFNVGDSRMTPAWVMENTKYYNDINDTKAFWCTETGGKDDRFCLTRLCRLEPSGYPRHADNMCYSTMLIRLKASYAMEGIVVRDDQPTGEKVKISKGDVISIEKLDEMSYLDVKTEDGTIVRIDFTFAYNDHYYRGSDRWVFDALACMFERAN